MFNKVAYPDIVHLVTGLRNEALPDEPSEVGLYYYARLSKDLDDRGRQALVASIKEAMVRSLSGTGMYSTLARGSEFVSYLTDAELDLLYHKGVNSIRRLHGHGAVLWDNQIYVKNRQESYWPTLPMIVGLTQVIIGINAMMNLNYGWVYGHRLRDVRVAQSEAWLLTIDGYMTRMLEGFYADRLMSAGRVLREGTRLGYELCLSALPHGYPVWVYFDKDPEKRAVTWSCPELTNLLPYLYSPEHQVHEVVEIT